MEAIMNDRIKSGLMVVGIFIACAGAIAQVPSPNAGIARGTVGATLSGNGNATAGGQIPRPEMQGTVRSQSDATAEATRRTESKAKRTSARDSATAAKAADKALKR